MKRRRYQQEALDEIAGLARKQPSKKQLILDAINDDLAHRIDITRLRLNNEAAGLPDSEFFDRLRSAAWILRLMSDRIDTLAAEYAIEALSAKKSK